jgi:peptide chain release factor 3
MTDLSQEIARRRTFAIISHPDAGKTTLTEKLLLYGGAVQLAGSVTQRRQQRATTSDWMELERQRGISISSTVLQFEYENYYINLLDTPGHQDFSEDTYRVLTAVDAAVMVIDAGKGIEPQTRKLFAVCRQRGVPIFTFMNKLDRPAREPLALLDELENVLGIHACAMNWPLGNGVAFKGVFDRARQQVHLFERTAGGMYRAPVSVRDLADPQVRAVLSDKDYQQVCHELELLDGAGATFDVAAVQAGRLTPVFFGSAVNNFGVQLLLDEFLAHASAPTPRRSGENWITPEAAAFSGFIFKIQANMDPRHRDRVAFVRVVSGKFERDMPAIQTRTGKKVRLGSSHKLFGRERETVNIAYPGDVIGLVGHDEFGIGDTLSTDPSIQYDEIPQFTPECFAYLRNPSPAHFKRFRAGLTQLLQERVVQSFELPGSAENVPLLAAVGPLQFEVVQFRLESEYGAASRLEQVPWKTLRWISPEVSAETLAAATIPTGVRVALDSAGRRALLFPSEWTCDYFVQKNPTIPISALPFRENVDDKAGR